MGLGTCMKCIKYSLFVFNFIFWLIGAGLLSFGLYLYFAPNARSTLDLGSQGLSTGALVIIVFGSVIMLLGFLGCCGSILENKCMLVVFFILMTLVFLAILTAGLLVIFFWQTVKGPMKDVLRENLVNKTTQYNNVDDAKNYMDALQTSGCVHQFEEFLDGVWLKIVIALFTTAFVALVGMVISMMLCCALRDEYD